MDVKFTDNSAEHLKLIEIAKKRALTAIGMTGEDFTKDDPAMPVKTGRARGSIAWATKEREGESFEYKDNEGKSYTDQIGSGADKDSVYLGSNVDYFPPIEEGGPNRAATHVLRNAATEHGEKYKELTKAAFDSVPGLTMT